GVQGFHQEYGLRVEIQADQFCADDGFVKLNIMSHQKACALHIRQKGVHYLTEGYPFFQSTLGRDAVELPGVIRDVEAGGADEIIMPGEELPPVIMELPGDLHQARRVVEVGYSRRFIMRYASSFGIENQVHRSGVLRSQDWEKTAVFA